MSNHTNRSIYYELLICGGGLVGASLALMLKPLGLRIALIEAQPFTGNTHPSFDERTTALSNSTRRIFDAIGVWSLLQPSLTPIQRIHVSDKGRFGFARCISVIPDFFVAWLCQSQLG